MYRMQFINYHTLREVEYKYCLLSIVYHIHNNITYYRPPITSSTSRYNSTYKSQRISRRLIPNINHVSITVHVSLYLLLLAAVPCRVCVILL